MSDPIRVKGLTELNKLLQTLPLKLEKNVMRGALRAGMKVVLAQAQQRVPVKTGTLRDGLKISTNARSGRVMATIKATGRHAFLAPWIEFGVAAHQITAGSSKWLYLGGGFAKAVQHPGLQPRAFMRPALDGAGQAAVVAAARYMKDRLAAKHGLDTEDVEIEGL